MKLILTVFLLCITIAPAANPMRPGVRGYAAPDARPDEFRVSFWGGLKFDPGRNTPPLSPDLLIEAYPGDGTGYYLVQFDGPVSEHQVEALVDVGVGFARQAGHKVHLDLLPARFVGGPDAGEHVLFGDVLSYSPPQPLAARLGCNGQPALAKLDSLGLHYRQRKAPP